MSDETKVLCIVTTHVFSRYPSDDESDGDIVTSDRWSFTFDDYNEDMETVLEGVTWEELCGPILPALARWAEMRRPKNDDFWVSFRFYTLWEVTHYRSYCWEYGVYEYDSEAYCVGLLDESKWTPESLGLVDKAEYE